MPYKRQPRAERSGSDDVKCGREHRIAARLSPGPAEIARPYQDEYEADTHEARHFLPVCGNQHDNRRAKQQSAERGQDRTETEGRSALFKVGIQFRRCFSIDQAVPPPSLDQAFNRYGK